MYEKFKTWLKNAGFTSAIYLLLGFLTMIFGGAIIGAGLAKYLSGAFFGIFAYVNWNVLKKVFKEDVIDKVDDLLSKDKK